MTVDIRIECDSVCVGLAAAAGPWGGEGHMGGVRCCNVCVEDVKPSISTMSGSGNANVRDTWESDNNSQTTVGF